MDIGPETEMLIKKMQARRDQAFDNHDLKYNNELSNELIDESQDEGNLESNQNRLLIDREHQGDIYEQFENESNKSY